MRVCPKCGLKTDMEVCPRDGANTLSVTDGVSTYTPGTLIAERYEVEQVLGIGGFGAVYRCNQLSMDKQVAVKVLKKEHIRSDEHIKRFAFEARIASKLTHPNTIQIFDFGANPADDALYLVMEFLQGETLANRLDRDHKIPAADVIKILKPVCHSLAEAHDKDLIHRDLKPENLMLTEVKGDPNYVKVLDFGIAARLAESPDSHEKLTEVGMIMGTPTYMSPEQAHGKALDARSDIYALGVLMYEMLTGEVPFDGDQPMNVLLKHISEAPTPLREMAPDADIPPALERLVLQCLEKEPMLRPQTCTELAEALTQVEQKPEGSLRRGRPQKAPNDLQVTEPMESLSDLQLPLRTAEPEPQSKRPATQGGFASPSGDSGSIWRGMALLLLVGIIAVVLTLALVPPEDDASSASATKAKATETSPKPAEAPAAVEPATPAAPVEAAPSKPAPPKPAPPKPAPSEPAPVKPAASTKPAADSPAPPKPTKPEVRVRPASAPSAEPRRKKPEPTKPTPKSQPPKGEEKKQPPKAKGPTRDDFRLDN